MGKNTDIYMDYNASAPLRPDVFEAMKEVFLHPGNPSSIHQAGRKARAWVEDARAKVADRLHAVCDQIIFTSGGTEANNLALFGMQGVQAFVSAIEHDSLLKASTHSIKIPVDEQGVVCLDKLEALLHADSLVWPNRPRLVSVMLANNETGVIQPIQDVVQIAKKYQAYVHTDAVQAFGKMDIDFLTLGVDMMSVSAHKVGGPKGVGALVVKDSVPLKPIQMGGHQEKGQRAGTENVAGIVGFGALASCLLTQECENLRSLRDRLEEQLEKVAPNLKIFSRSVARLPNTSCFALPYLKSELQLMQLDLQNVYVSAGAACSSSRLWPSHVLTAMGYGPAYAQCSLRISLGWQTRAGDIEHFVDTWTKLYDRKKTELEGYSSIKG